MEIRHNRNSFSLDNTKKMFVKVTGAFMSLDASGTFGGLLTASKWKGQPYIRQRVTPSNPNSAGQIAQRLIFGGISKACKAVLTSYADVGNEGSQFFQDARAYAPSGQSWISTIQKNGDDLVTKALAFWATIDSTEKGYFTTEAGVIGLSDYNPVLGGETKTGLTAGQQLVALGFFTKDYLNNVIGTNAVGDDSPSEMQVQALGAYVHDSTA